MRQSREQIQQEALTRAITGQSMSNYPAIFQGFMEKGIPEDQIKPRENVLSFQAWKKLGRYVRRGEHGVKICTFVPVPDSKSKSADPDEQRTRLMPHYVAVFHITQTEASA